MDERSDREVDDAQHALLEELESVSSMLIAPRDPPPAAADSEIPVLLDVVEIPVLETSLDPHPTTHDAADKAADGQVECEGPTALTEDAEAREAPAPDRVALREALHSEAAAILEDLLDEFMPRIEARFRQRFEARSRALIESAGSAAKPDD
jgi:hypothetical protein